MLHAPEGGFGGARVLLCSPLGYEGQFAYITFSDVAASIAATSNAVVMTFDYDGTGDSAGIDEDPDPIGRTVASVHAAIDYLKAIPGPPGPVIVIGLRAGAVVAAYAAVKRSDVAAIALWAPVSGRAFLREHRVFSQLSDTNPPPPRGRARDLGVRGFEANGCVFTDEAVDALEAMDLKKLEKPPAPRIFVLHRADMRSFRAPPEAWSTAEFEEQDAPGYAEMMDPPWLWIPPRIATRALVDWVHRVAAPHRPSLGALAPLQITPEDHGVMPDGSEERGVWFGPRGRRFGVLTLPKGAKPDHACLLVSSVFSYRIGPNRSNVFLARRLASMGIASLRVDVTGVGDSREHIARPPAHPYDEAAVGDAVHAIDHLRSMGFARLSAAGICAGAFVCWRAAERAGGALNLILVNIGRFDPAPYTREHHTEWRAGTPASAMKPGPDAPIGAKARWFLRRAAKAALLGKTIALASAPSRLRPTGLPARLFDIGRRGGRVFLVFSHGDMALNHYKRWTSYHHARLTIQETVGVRVIAGPDHSFTPRWAVFMLLDVVTKDIASWSR
jgi:dienelactone hydrolase